MIQHSGNITEYANAAALIASTIVPKNNDIVQLADGSMYNWKQGGVDVADGDYIIDQASATASGRWIKQISAKSVTTYPITLETLPAGATSEKTPYTATGVLPTNANLVSHGGLPSGLILLGLPYVSANDQIVVEYQNTNSTPATGVVFNVRVVVI